MTTCVSIWLDKKLIVRHYAYSISLIKSLNPDFVFWGCNYYSGCYMSLQKFPLDFEIREARTNAGILELFESIPAATGETNEIVQFEA